MRSRGARVKASGLPTTPPLGSRAKPATALSIPAASRAGVRLNCTAKDGAAASIDSQYWPECVSGLKMAIARVTPGAISLSSSSHLPPIRGLEIGESDKVRTGTCQARDEAAADRVCHLQEHDRHGGCFLVQRPRRRRALRHNDVGGEAGQFFRLRPHPVQIAAGAKAEVDDDIAAFRPSKFGEGL